MQKLHFISGLPRSGSTLLGSILRQNSRILAGMSSPLATIFSAAAGAMSARNDLSVFMDHEQRMNVLRGLFHTYYASKVSTPIVFDTNRQWCGRIGAIAQLLPDSKVICCVRNVTKIIDSIEWLVQGSPMEESRMFPPQASQYGLPPPTTVYSRAEMLMGRGGVISVALDALREAYYGPHVGRLMLIRYESLARDPARTLSALYQFIAEEPFSHDFENVEFSADEFDRPFGMPGLHAVRRRVGIQERQMIVPPDIAARFNIEFWNEPKLSRPDVRIV